MTLVPTSFNTFDEKKTSASMLALQPFSTYRQRPNSLSLSPASHLCFHFFLLLQALFTLALSVPALSPLSGDEAQALNRSGGVRGDTGLSM